MDDILKIKLEKLIQEHPELRNCEIDLSGPDFTYRTKEPDSTSENGLQLAECRRPISAPDRISGHSAKVEVRKSPLHGYGIFAKTVIEEGELIEESLLLKLGLRGNYLNDKVLKDYVWGNISCKCSECRDHGTNQYMALGLGSLYNHSDTPNTRQKTDFQTGMMTIKARYRIEKDEEVFVSYGKKYWLIRDFWKNLDKKKLEKYNKDNNLSH